MPARCRVSRRLAVLTVLNAVLASVMRTGSSWSSEVNDDASHTLFRLAFVLSIRAPLVAIACSLGAPASAADVDTIAHMRPAQSHQVAPQGGVIQSVPIQAALDLLKWSPDHVPMIEVVDACPRRVNPRAQGWTVYNEDGSAWPTIYVAGWSALYRAVLANRLDVHDNVIRLAGVLAHERTHIEHGQNEELAYFAQLTTLEHLQAHDIDLANVRRALETVKRQQRQRR